MERVQALNTNILQLADNLACPRNCSGHGTCLGGVCICQVQWTGSACNQANYPYVIPFGTVFSILTLVSFVQLALAIYHDSQRSGKDQLREAFRFSVHKWLYFVAWLAAASRAFFFIMQEGLSNSFALNVQSIYYPFLITLGSLLSCLLGERYYLETPTSESRSINKSLLPYISFNVVLWASFFTMIILTFALPVEDQATVHRSFYLFFAFLMFCSLVFFLFFGIMMFYKLTGAFRTDECRVNTTQLSLSRAGVFFQAIFQLALVTLLVLDFCRHFIELSGHAFNDDLFIIISRITDLAVMIWFPCALWNCKKPETMWILNPRLVLETGSLIGEFSPLYAESQLAYGSTTVRRPSAGRRSPVEKGSGLDCWICYDSESQESGPLICPCDCKGDTAAVHHNCLRRWIVEQQEGTYSMFRKSMPRCDICKTPYTLKKPTCFNLLCTKKEAIRIGILSALALAVVGVTIGVLAKFSDFFQKHTSSFPTQILVIFAAIIAVVILMRFLGVTCNTVCNRSLMMSVVIHGRQPAADASGDDDRCTSRSHRPGGAATVASARSLRVSSSTGDGSLVVTTACVDVAQEANVAGFDATSVAFSCNQEPDTIVRT